MAALSSEQAVLLTDASGWVLALLLAASVAVPFGLSGRIPFLPARRPSGDRRPYLERLAPHYLIGYLSLAIALAHSWLPMRPEIMRAADRTGILLATAALLALVGQVAMGIVLRRSRLTKRVGLRRAHFWVMIAVAALTLVHVVRN